MNPKADEAQLHGLASFQTKTDLMLYHSLPVTSAVTSNSDKTSK